MIIAVVIGIVLCALCLWILKNTRDICGEPVLKTWMAILLVIFALIPFLGATIGISALLVTGMAYDIEDLSWRSEKSSNRFINFLNRPIS